jgi:rhodanese-related sulfurtransferase
MGLEFLKPWWRRNPGLQLFRSTWARSVEAEADLTGFKRTLLQGGAILLFGSGLGLGINAVSLQGIPLRPAGVQADAAGVSLTVKEAYARWLQGTALFLDARAPADFDVGHIAGALNLPARSFAEHISVIAPLLTPASPMIVYCDGLECDLSHRVAGELRHLGYTNLYWVVNGWTEWKRAGFPKASTESP